MERAENDRFVWTDDDFDRASDWLDRLVAVRGRHGSATVIPEFVGEKWWRLVEPVSFVMATLTMYLRAGAWAGNAWGGGVTFTRDDVDIEELLTDLRACVSDDGALSDHLGDAHAIRSMRASVHVPGDLHAVTERMSRFSRITHVHEGEVGEFVASVLVVGLALLFPIYAAISHGDRRRRLCAVTDRTVDVPVRVSRAVRTAADIRRRDVPRGVRVGRASVSPVRRERYRGE